MQAMILAAGFGTRLRPYTLLRPKPLFPICNTPLLHLLLDKLRLIDCERVVVNSHYLADQIATALADRPEVILQYEQDVLGTGGGLRKAMQHFADGPVLVMNGDIYHDIDVQQLMAAHRISGLPVTLALHDYPRFNVVQVQEHRVCSFGKGRSSQQSLAFTGLHILNREILERIPAQGFFHVIDLYEQLAQEKLIGFMRTDGTFWQDIGTLEDYLALHRHLLEGKKTAWLISDTARIGKNVTLNDWGVLGPHAVISANVELTRCVVWENTHITSPQQLSDQIIATDI
jgi:mannose-1-phosphate guanylyltransferase